MTPRDAVETLSDQLSLRHSTVALLLTLYPDKDSNGHESRCRIQNTAHDFGVCQEYRQNRDRGNLIRDDVENCTEMKAPPQQSVEQVA